MKHLTKCLLFAALPALIFFVVSMFLLNRQGFAIPQLLRDPAQQRGVSSMIGFLSNVGVFLWVSSGGIYLFTRVQSTGRADPRDRELVLLLGLLSLTLAVDDFFMIHEQLAHEGFIYIFYAVVSLGILVRHHHILFSSRNISFFMAIGMLGLSVFVDVNQFRLERFVSENLRITAEDGSKFLGGAIWLYFAVKICGEVLGLHAGSNRLGKDGEDGLPMEADQKEVA